MRNGEYSRMVLGVTHDLNPALQGGMPAAEAKSFRECSQTADVAR
jgi:hypothetical protein